jgi:hypothetical protein
MWENGMINTTMFRIMIAACFLAASLFFVSAVGATTENECLIGGGHIASGSGCSFCVGGKYDLTEITQNSKPVKRNLSHSGSDQQKSAASSVQSVNGAVAESPPAGN